jgi:RNA polymerase sigma-70 factor (ECF subfamily)
MSPPNRPPEAPPTPPGDGEGWAAEVVARYGRRLVVLAERRLSPQVARRLDGEDVVQSVFRTFFRRCACGEFKIDASEQLWRLLVAITLRKAQARARQHLAGKRRVGAEAPGGDQALAGVADPEPGPEDAVLLIDQIEALLHGLPDWYARLLDLRLQGHSAAEIAPQLNVSRQTVYRGLALLGQRLNAALAAERAEKT